MYPAGQVRAGVTWVVSISLAPRKANHAAPATHRTVTYQNKSTLQNLTASTGRTMLTMRLPGRFPTGGWLGSLRPVRCVLGDPKGSWHRLFQSEVSEEDV